MQGTASTIDDSSVGQSDRDFLPAFILRKVVLWYDKGVVVVEWSS